MEEGKGLSMERIIVEASLRIPKLLEARRPPSLLDQPLYRRPLRRGLPLIIQSVRTLELLTGFGPVYEGVLDDILVSVVLVYEPRHVMGLHVDVHEHVGALLVPHPLGHLDVGQGAGAQGLDPPDVAAARVYLVSNPLHRGHQRRLSELPHDDRHLVRGHSYLRQDTPGSLVEVNQAIL